MTVKFHNEFLNNNDTFDISVVILTETPIDIIIGRDTIKKYKLFDKIPSQLKGDNLIQEDLQVGNGTKRCECQPEGGSKKQRY